MNRPLAIWNTLQSIIAVVVSEHRPHLGGIDPISGPILNKRRTSAITDCRVVVIEKGVWRKSRSNGNPSRGWSVGRVGRVADSFFSTSFSTTRARFARPIEVKKIQSDATPASSESAQEPLTFTRVCLISATPAWKGCSCYFSTFFLTCFFFSIFLREIWNSVQIPHLFSSRNINITI